MSTGTVFYKMSGSGNDFVVLDGRHSRLDQWPTEKIVAICDRRMGAGADGFVILTPTAVPGEIRFDFLNSDGSRASMCGNAALCSTRLAVFLEMAPAEGMTLITDAGRVTTRCTGPGHMAEIRLPDFDLPVPVEVEPRQGESGFYLGTVGVPHLVVVTNDVSQVDVMSRGRELRFHAASGPTGANVNFVSPPSGDGGSWRIRTYERGVEAETLACGTGTVASAFVADLLGRYPLPSEWLTVRGIRLGVSGQREGGRGTGAWLLGEGRLVYAGVIQ